MAFKTLEQIQQQKLHEQETKQMSNDTTTDAPVRDTQVDDDSMDMTLDLTLAQPTIPEGPYKVMVANSVKKPSQSSEYPLVVLTLQVQEGEYAGYKLTERLSLSPAVGFKWIQFFDAAGIPTVDDNGKPIKDMKIVPAEYIGLEFAVNVADNTYNDQTRSAVASYIPKGGNATAKKNNAPATSSQRRRTA